MDLKTVEVLGLWNLPHIGVGGSLCPPGSARKGGPFLMNTMIQGTLEWYTLLSCFLAHVYFTTASAPSFLCSDFHLFYSAQGHPRQSWQTAFWLQSYIASRHILLFDPDRFVSRDPLSSTGNHWIGGLILQQQKCLVNLWFDRLVISESDSVLDDGILLFSVQYLTR